MSLDSLKPVEAKCIGATLVASFHRANPPLVWRFDLERNHSFSLALQGEESEWELGLTSTKGDFQPVAHFAVREDAEEAFVRVERLLSKHAPSSTSSSSFSFFRMCLKILAVLFLVGVFVVLAGLVSVGRNFLQTASELTHGVGLPNAAVVTPLAGYNDEPQTTAAKPGTPVSADDFLSKSGAQ